MMFPSCPNKEITTRKKQFNVTWMDEKKKQASSIIFTLVWKILNNPGKETSIGHPFCMSM